LARIVSIDKEMALTAAKYEAHRLDEFKGSTEQEIQRENKRVFSVQPEAIQREKERMEKLKAKRKRAKKAKP
jgi:hypothetical protein